MKFESPEAHQNLIVLLDQSYINKAIVQAIC